jgi:uncharacterized protein with FMN-binding domain
MNKKNITIIAFISIFGIGLFVTIFTLLGAQSSTSKLKDSADSIKEDSNPPTVIMESMKPVKQIDPPKAVTTPSTTPTSVDATTTKTPNIYKDGNYSFSLSYRVPEGNTEKISTSITVSGDAIKSVKNTNTATNRSSREYQGDFEAKIQSAVVGKKIDSLNLDSVGGASLTTDAFVKAISEIKSQAKS